MSEVELLLPTVVNFDASVGSHKLSPHFNLHFITGHNHVGLLKA